MITMHGFVDLQVNGFQGIDFSQPGLTLDKIVKVTEALIARGTVAYCPTVITSSQETYHSNLPVLAEACRDSKLGRHLLGIHLEGPFISPEDGARGAHQSEFVVPPDIDLMRHLLHLSGGEISLVTLAPELSGSEKLIGFLGAEGITVSLGHHLATDQQIQRACDRGAKAVTHLGNGIPNYLPRHPNPLWSQLAEDRLRVMVITDGHHLPESFIRVVASLKRAEGLIVVSDSAPIAGYAPGKYKTLGQDVVLEESGRLWNPVGDHLVGSSACMLECVNFLAGLELFSKDELIQVGLENPLKLIGRTLDHEAFKNAPLITFKNGNFSIK